MIYGELMASAMRDAGFPKGTRVESTESYLAVHPKSGTKRGIVFGWSKLGVRVKWDDRESVITVSPRHIKVTQHGD